MFDLLFNLFLYIVLLRLVLSLSMYKSMFSCVYICVFCNGVYDKVYLLVMEYYYIKWVWDWVVSMTFAMVFPYYCTYCIDIWCYFTVNCYGTAISSLKGLARKWSFFLESLESWKQNYNYQVPGSLHNTTDSSYIDRRQAISLYPTQ